MHDCGEQSRKEKQCCELCAKDDDSPNRKWAEYAEVALIGGILGSGAASLCCAAFPSPVCAPMLLRRPPLRPALVLATGLLLLPALQAAEGMWPLNHLPQATLKAGAPRIRSAPWPMKRA